MSQKKKIIIPTGSEVWDYINNGNGRHEESIR